MFGKPITMQDIRNYTFMALLAVLLIFAALFLGSFVNENREQRILGEVTETLIDFGPTGRVIRVFNSGDECILTNEQRKRIKVYTGDDHVVEGDIWKLCIKNSRLKTCKLLKSSETPNE